MSIVVDRPEKGIARLQLNRPEKRNALNGPMVADCLAALDEIASHTDIRLLILSAAGQDFCAGADLAWMQKMASASQIENEQDALQLATLFYRLHVMPMPVLALVQGATFGGGMGIVSACDMVVAATDATFSFPETHMGLSPSVVSPWVVPILGERQARFYFLTGEKMSAADAKGFGFVHQVVPANDLNESGLTLAKKIVRKSPMAIAETRKLMKHVGSLSVTQHVIEMTAVHLAFMRQSPDAVEGLKAFFEKRQPVWGELDDGNAHISPID